MNFKVLIAAALLALVVQAAALEPPPTGWGEMPFGGPQQLPGSCEMGIDRDLATAGQPNISIKCANRTVPSFGGLQQSFESAPYRGKRVRYSAWILASGVEAVGEIPGQAGLFIAVPTGNGPLLNRMDERALTGWTNWEYRDFVVDVPADGGPFLGIGFWMQGTGQIWVRDFNVEVVPETVPTNLSPETDPVPGPNLELE
jgi:hypothetical protein